MTDSFTCHHCGEWWDRAPYGTARFAGASIPYCKNCWLALYPDEPDEPWDYFG